jgi:hypothetical protein
MEPRDEPSGVIERSQNRGTNRLGPANNEEPAAAVHVKEEALVLAAITKKQASDESLGRGKMGALGLGVRRKRNGVGVRQARESPVAFPSPLQCCLP